MNANTEVVYWLTNPEWSEADENGDPRIRDDAPERAKKSFEMWLHNDRKPKEDLTKIVYDDDLDDDE